MTYEVTGPFWQFVHHWQSLITGVLALVAGLGTIWATIASAQREIAANQAQTKVGQDQLATTLRLEDLSAFLCAFVLATVEELGPKLREIKASARLCAFTRRLWLNLQR